MNTQQLKSLIIRVLDEIGLLTPGAVELLLGTAAQESAMGTYIRQLGNGPALGIFQMEPATFNDIIENFLRHKLHLRSRVENCCNVKFLKSSDLETNLALSICFARLHYYRKFEDLPQTLDGMARYWKKHYNTPLGRGTEAEFIENYNRYVKAK